MPIWSEVLRELHQSTSKGLAADFDGVRRKYLNLLHEHTGREVILYASGWLQKEAPARSTSIVDEDIHGLMEVTSSFSGQKIDLILHSPGGSVEATEAIVSYLRSRFSHIRVIVPQFAKSAATMIACASDEIVMGKHSFLGPTDPQILLSTTLGLRNVATQEILKQFDLAKNECSDPSNLSAWLPMLNQFGPDLIVRCQTALELSESLVKIWLKSYMFKDDIESEQKSESIAKWIAGQGHKSHNRHLTKEKLIQKGLKIQHLEDDQILQDLSLSIFHAVTMAFTDTNVTKMIENHLGQAFMKSYVSQSSNSP